MMLTKSQNASAPASAKATLFKYSKEQWREIEAEIQTIWNGAFSLSEARRKLEHAARHYLAGLLGANARQESSVYEINNVGDWAFRFRVHRDILP